MRRGTWRTWTIVGTVLVVVVVVAAAGLGRWGQHRMEDRAAWFGQNHLAGGGVGLRSVSAFPLDDRTVISGSSPFARNSSLTVTENTAQQRGLVTGQGVVGFDAQGAAWTVEWVASAAQAVLMYRSPDDAARGGLLQRPVWPLRDSGGDREPFVPLAADDGVTILERGCIGDGPCEVVGVQAQTESGRSEVLWRHDASASMQPLSTTGATIYAGTTDAAAAFARIGVFVQDDRLAIVDTSGERTTTDLIASSRSTFGVVDDQLLAVTQDGGRCTVTADTLQGRQWTSEDLPCRERPVVQLRDGTLYLMTSTNSTGTSFADVAAVSLDDGSVAELDDLTGLVGLGSDLVVDGEAGRYRAQSARDGETLWTTELKGVDPEDTPLGTGRASVGEDLVVVTHTPSSWARLLTGSNGQRASVLDPETGDVLTTTAAPDGNSYNEVVAVRGRVLLFDTRGWVTTLTP